MVVKLGVWASNVRARRDKLAQEQLDALRELGVEWAGHRLRLVVEPGGQANCTERLRALWPGLAGSKIG